MHLRTFWNDAALSPKDLLRIKIIPSSAVLETLATFMYFILFALLSPWL